MQEMRIYVRSGMTIDEIGALVASALEIEMVKTDQTPDLPTYEGIFEHMFVSVFSVTTDDEVDGEPLLRSDYDYDITIERTASFTMEEAAEQMFALLPRLLRPLEDRGCDLVVVDDEERPVATP